MLLDIKVTFCISVKNIEIYSTFHYWIDDKVQASKGFSMPIVDLVSDIGFYRRECTRKRKRYQECG